MTPSRIEYKGQEDNYGRRMNAARIWKDTFTIDYPAGFRQSPIKNPKFPKPPDNTKTIITQDIITQNKHTEGPEPMIQDMQGCISGGHNIMCKGADDFWFRQFSYLRVFLPIFFNF